MSKCVNCLKEINEKEVFCLTCHEEVLECAKNQIADLKAKLAEKERQLKLAEELLIKQEKEYDAQLEKQAKIHYKHLKEKDQRIAELEEQLANSIRPKFPRQEHICGFAFGEIREYIVVAYLDNDITLCENIETSELEWCDNKFLVRTFEEAQAKLKELGEKK